MKCGATERAWIKIKEGTADPSPAKRDSAPIHIIGVQKAQMTPEAKAKAEAEAEATAEATSMFPTKCVGTQKPRFGEPDRFALSPD